MEKLIGTDASISEYIQLGWLVIMLVGLFVIDYWLEKNP